MTAFARQAFPRHALSLALAAGCSWGWGPAMASSAAAQSPGGAFGSPTRFLEADGEAIYRGICQGCHMPDGQGAVGAGRYPALAGNDRLQAAGYPVSVVVNGQKAMPPFGPLLDDGQIAAVVNYVRTHFGNAYQERVTAADVRAARPAPETSATAGGVIRHRTPNSNFPIARAVEVPAGKTLLYVSGMVPPVADDKAVKDTIAAYGDTRTQTIAVMKAIEAALKSLGLSIGDIVRMQVFLVGDPARDGRMDFAGFMDGYRQFFGTAEQPNLPARSVMQVAGLVNPGWLVEIEVTAVRP